MFDDDTCAKFAKADFFTRLVIGFVMGILAVIIGIVVSVIAIWKSNHCNLKIKNRQVP